jgi:UDP-N-acetylmuramate dehydrogenase
MRERTDVPLAPLTTLRIGGAASRLVDLESESDVVDAERDATARGEPVFVLGGGSNVVVADEGFPGLVARVALRGVHVSRAGDRTRVDVAAGESWDALVARAVDEGWRGVECMSGIPGLVGATPIQNVGAYGQEVSDTLIGVRVFDRESSAFVEMSPHDCAFAYRTSVFKRSDRCVVTAVRFAFETGVESAPIRYAELARALSIREGERASSKAVRETVVALRRSKGMVLDAGDPESVSAGSFFVNPVVDARTLARVEERARETAPRFDAGDGRYKLAAAWLVERAGFPKGWGAGRVGVSRRHALALVNRGGATSSELLAVARAIREGVMSRFGVELAPEPVFVGCSWS